MTAQRPKSPLGQAPGSSTAAPLQGGTIQRLLRDGARGLDFAGGEALMAPRDRVQMKGSGKPVQRRKKADTELGPFLEMDPNELFELVGTMLDDEDIAEIDRLAGRSASGTRVRGGPLPRGGGDSKGTPDAPAPSGGTPTPMSGATPTPVGGATPKSASPKGPTPPVEEDKKRAEPKPPMPVLEAPGAKPKGGAPAGPEEKSDKDEKDDRPEVAPPSTSEEFVACFKANPAGLVKLFESKTTKPKSVRWAITAIDKALGAFVGASAKDKTAKIGLLKTAISGWMAVKGKKGSARQPGIDALSEAIKWFELDVKAQADPKLTTVDDKRAKHNSVLAPSSFKLTITYPVVAGPPVAVASIPPTVSLSLVDQKHRAMLPADFMDLAKRVIELGVSVTLPVQQPKQTDDPAFVPNVEVDITTDLSALSHAFKTCDSAAQGAQKGLTQVNDKTWESVRELERLVKRKTAHRIGDMNKDKIVAGYRAGVDAKVTGEAKTALDSKVEVMRARVLGLGMDVTAAVNATVDKARRGDSQTLQGDGAKKGTENWQKADADVRGMAKAKTPMSVEALSGVNKTLEDGMGTKGGKVRDLMEYAGTNTSITRFYLFPDKVRDELKRLLDWVNDEVETPGFNPLIAAAKAHQWLVSIHPFADANGRTGKLLQDYILMRGGLPPSIAPNDSKMGVLGATIMTGEIKPADAMMSAIDKVERGLNNTLDKSKKQ